ncbi:MAG TPA: helix-turn-helix domain-containing protein [Pirellulaceae bacterium]
MTTALFTLPLSAATAEGLPLRGACVTERNVFFAGPENALIRSLVRLVDESISGPIGGNSPLVLYGPRGVGKSALAQALAERRRQNLTLESVIITTGPDFARSLATAVEADSVADHRARHHRCDLLVIDDLQRLANKPAAQQFLISALDALQKRGSLVIVTLNQLPQATAGLTPALVSRLLGGLVVRLALPGPLARRELARQAASRLNLSLDEQEIDRVARANDDSTDHYLSAGKVRELVLQLAASHELGPQEQGAQQHKAVCRRAVSLVAKHFALPVSDIRGKSRRQAIADARGVAMYLIRRLTALSYAEVGRLFSNRDHTTVLHACRKVEAQMSSDTDIRTLVDELVMQLGAEGAI